MIIFNPTESAIIDYPIQDKKTKETKLWSIQPGETLEFPDEVGTYLCLVYGFLQRVITEEDLKREQEEELKKQKGTSYPQVKVIPASSVVVPPVKKFDGFTKEVISGPGAKTPQELVEEKKKEEETITPIDEEGNPVGVPCKFKGCDRVFTNEAMMKTHYAHKHLTFD